MQKMKVYYNVPGKQMEEGCPVYPLAVGVSTFLRGQQSGVYGMQCQHCGVNFGISGIGEMTVMGNTYTIMPGETVWYLPNEDNTVKALTDEWEYRWVTFSGPLASAILLSYNYSRHLSGGDVTATAKTFDNINQIIDLEGMKNRRELAYLAMRLLAEVGGGASSVGISLTDRFMELVRTEYGTPELNVNIICDRLRVSPATLHRLVSRAFHKSPGEILRNTRIMHAHALLRNTSLSIGEISNRTGFSDEAYFCRLIKQVSNCTPLEYRQQESGKIS